MEQNDYKNCFETQPDLPFSVEFITLSFGVGLSFSQRTYSVYRETIPGEDTLELLNPGRT